MKISFSLKASAAALAMLTLAGCQEGNQQLSQNNKHYTPISAEMQATLTEKGVSKNARMLIRAYKQESELEVWKQNSAGEFVLVKTFPMCRWSGQLGPKKKEGDRQVPEGFYSITPGAMNPNSSYFLSFNVGFPNAYDKAHGRTGALIMVHGACSSMGCFSMTDRQIADIYALARESFAGGQASIQMQSYPFRFTPQNLAKFRADPNMPFWKMLKEGNDSFEVTKRETQVSVCNQKYVFNRGNSSVCAPDAASPVVSAVAAKARADEVKVAELARSTPAVRRIYSDGDQHPVFKRSQYADNSASSSSVLIASTQVSSIPDVSRPDALAKGPVEVAVADAPVKVAATPPAKIAAGAPVNATPRPAAPAQAAAFAAEPAKPAEQPSFFRKWLGNDAPAAPAAATAEVEKPVAAPAVKAKVDPAKAKQSKAKTPDKTADATIHAIPEETSVFKNFTALIPGWR